MPPFFGIGGAMTINEAIERVNALKYNQYSDEDKIIWLDRLDRSVMDQIIGTHEGAEEITFSGYTADTDRNTVLLVPAPYDEMYIRWLEAQIDYQNEEYDLYNVSITLYNNLFSYYSAVYNRDHMPIQRVKMLSF